MVTLSGALLKALCEIAAQAAGAMEWAPDGLLLHSGMSAPSPCVPYPPIALIKEPAGSDILPERGINATTTAGDNG